MPLQVVGQAGALPLPETYGRQESGTIPLSICCVRKHVNLDEILTLQPPPDAIQITTVATHIIVVAGDQILRTQNNINRSL